MIKLNLDYLRKGTFITFLWRPKAYFTSLQNNPLILLPLAIALIFLIIRELIVFLTLPSFISKELLSNNLALIPIFTIIILLLTTLYFFMIFTLAKNKQSFQLIFSIVIHAFLVSLYGAIVFEVIQIIIINLSQDTVKMFKLSNLGGLIYFVYLGMGLKWGLSISKGQFLFAFITFILLIILLAIILIVLVILLLFAFLNDISEAFTQFWQVFIGQ